MHQLMRDTLRAELSHQEPELEPVLHARAADWYEAAGDIDRSIEHRLQAGDPLRLEEALWRVAPFYMSAGRTATVERWLETFTLDELSRRPALAVTKAWCGFTAGDMPTLRYWAAVATELDDDLLLPDGTETAAAAALLRALIGADGIEQTRADAAEAYELDRLGSVFRAVARYIEGGTLAIQGRRAEARERLADGEMLGALGSPAAQAQCLGQLAALAVDDGDWDGAERFIGRLDGILERFALRERPAMGVAIAVAALVRAHFGDSTEARAEAKHALFLVSMLATVAPWIQVESRIFLARAFLLLGDVGLARTLTREGIEMLDLIPDGEPLRARLAEVEHATEGESVPLGVLATPMTPAEMRVLRYLPTHLTFAAIAEELFVSRNTVKTQAIAIYRKLGVSSRDPAVVAARSLGLLEH
jgi:LuxR family maltose regulon positive regulatory protein